MKTQRRSRKLPPIQTWTEVIDNRTVAGIALAREHRSQRTWVGNNYVRRLAIYQHTEFVILDWRQNGERWGSYRARSEEAAREKLVLACPGGGHNLKFVGYWENDEKA